MSAIATRSGISWSCRHTWRRASVNTMWCLIGCSIGDMGTILFFSGQRYSLANTRHHESGDHEWASDLYPA